MNSNITSADNSLDDTDNDTDHFCHQITDDKAWGVLVPCSNKYQTVRMKNNEIIFGRDPNCQFVFEKVKHNLTKEEYSNLSREHMVLRFDAGVAYLRDLSFNGTYVNGLKVGRYVEIKLLTNTTISLCHENNISFTYHQI